MELPKDAFTRLDKTDDTRFYSIDRFVEHLDSLALDTIEKLVGSLVVEENPVILDLMASWDSHIPESVTGAKVVGLGLNRNELRENKALDRYVLHDLNQDPNLPFADAIFDVVICTVSVDYMTKPTEVFRDIGRILKPGRLFMVIFSNRMFEQKAVKIWRTSSEDERIFLLEDLFNQTGLFDKPRVSISRGKLRPRDD